MAKFLEVIETMRAEEASQEKLYGGEGLNIRNVRKNPKYAEALKEAQKLMANVFKGDYRAWGTFREAMTTDDFPLLFGDILDRMLLAGYMETPQVYRNFIKIATVRDFRDVKRFATSGAESVLSEVKEQEEYPEDALGEAEYTYGVKKYGRRIPFSWETMINDDLNALKDIPARFGRAARRSESKFATGLYCDASGPDATFYSAGNSNIVTGNPVLDVDGLTTAMKVLSDQRDADGEPIAIDTVHLVVPPALEIVAGNMLNAVQLRLTKAGGVDTTDASAKQELVVANWMRNRLILHVDYYIPVVAFTANADTSWWLFANPNNGRPALEMGFLAGHLTPEIFIKSPNAQRVGGGVADPMGGDFDTDSIQYKVRHVFGGTTLDPKMTVASNGSAS
jgi:hypothetical protein